MDQAADLAILILLAVWLLLDVLYALFNKRMGRFTYRFDPFRWISAYQLFSPTPRSFRLYYRDQLPDRSLTQWNEAIYSSVKWYAGFWSPRQIVTSTIQSAMDDLIRFKEADGEIQPKRNIADRFIYKSLLNFVFRFNYNKVFYRQFKIDELVGITGNYTRRELFMSDFHRQ
jgi:hypothetical protein